MIKLLPDQWDLVMIRPATEEDLPDIDRIYNQAIEQGYCTAHLSSLTKNERIAWFKSHDKNYPVYVMESDSGIVGWSSLSTYRPGREALSEVAEISIYVDFHNRREGIGSKLIQHNINNAANLGKRIYFAIVIEGNAGSVKLLEKFGFEQWAFLPEVAVIRGEKRGHIYMGLILNK